MNKIDQSTSQNPNQKERKSIMKNTVFKTPLIAASLGVLLGLPGAMAATVTWSSPELIGDGTTGAFSVSTGHVVFAADKAGSADVTVGGINFVDETTVAFSGGNGFLTNTGYYTSGTDPDVNTLLDTRYSSFSSASTITIGLSGLELGKEYTVRLYFADSDRDPDRFYTATAGNSSDPILAEADMYLAGTFTADGTTQDITVSGDFPLVNAVLVTVPEPSAALLGALGVLGLLRRRR